MALAEVALRPDLTVPDFRKIKPKTVRSHAYSVLVQIEVQ